MAKRSTSKFIRIYGATLEDLAGKYGVKIARIYHWHQKGWLAEMEKLSAEEIQHRVALDLSDKKIRSRVIKTFRNIQQRCTSPNDIKYSCYGGRGIRNRLTLDDLVRLWKRDGAEKMRQPSIDRIDGNGHYAFINCRFVEMEENRKRRAPVLDA